MTNNNPDTDTQNTNKASNSNTGAHNGVLRVLTMGYRETAQFYAKNRDTKGVTASDAALPKKEEECSQDDSQAPSL